MNPERISQLRDHLIPGRNPDCISGSMLGECLDEIERLQAELQAREAQPDERRYCPP